MKFITGGFVSEQEAGQRLFQVAHDPRCSKSGGENAFQLNSAATLMILFELKNINFYLDLK